ncbi:MAG: mitochondrial fission ELM1 family protein [Verrucomicrobiota bacterium]
MTEPLIIWLLGDGKPGHENQSLGLTDAIARTVSCEIHRISLAGKRGLFTRIKAASRASAGFPKPDLIIAAGHATHPSLLWLARRHHARSVVLMRPSLPMAWFDLCIVPAHDFPNGCERGNLVLTRGALNRVAPPGDSPRSGKMILIGGPSASHGWDGGELLAALTEISANGGWQLTDSRRTPDGFIDKIRKQLPAIEIFPHHQTTPEWLPGKLATADEVWVTEDSVSMVYEALSSGAKVGLLPVPRLQENSRVLRGLEELVARKFLTPFADWEGTRRLTQPPETLREADRCAAMVLDRM